MRSTILFAVLTLAGAHWCPGAPIKASIVDADSGMPLAARVYVYSAAKKEYYHVTSAIEEGSAVAYSRKSGIASIEIHTAVSAHPFTVDLPDGDYSLTVVRGKEYIEFHQDFSIPQDSKLNIRLKRWIDMEERGWFSGDTHVHRTVEELPAVQLAEDLNVAFPLTAWVTDSRDAPSLKNKNPDRVPEAKLEKIDATHVYWPVNTEYEIFTVDGKDHTLGAFFILNHKSVFTQTAPPVAPIAAEARKQGGILELDKHNWPWSMMIVQQMGVELYELSNNHMWRTRFGFRTWYSEYADESMGIGIEGRAFTELGWIHFGFENYYTLLNCGLDLKPTAGTASGVHPVPLGFGRVYVNLEGEFSYEKWLAGLLAGNSFVTTGPMLFTNMTRQGDSVAIDVVVEAPMVGGIEIIRNGEIVYQAESQPELTEAGSQRAMFSTSVPLDGSSWIAVRTWSEQEGRPRFAHSAPVHFDVPDKPLRPRKRDTDYLIRRLEDELTRHQRVLPDAALQEYRDVLAHYRKLAMDAQ